MARKLLKEGLSIYTGCINYDESDYYYASIFSEIWKIMNENAESDFEEIDADLSY